METVIERSVLGQAGKDTVNSLLAQLVQDKESVLSVRLDTGLSRALEEQTKVLGLKNVSSTVRTILSFYFLPAVYKLEWQGKQVQDFKNAIVHQQTNGISSEQMKVNYFLKALFEYMAFLEQTKQASNETLKFAQETEEQLNGAIVEMQGKIQQALKELEQEQGAE